MYHTPPLYISHATARYHILPLGVTHRVEDGAKLRLELSHLPQALLEERGHGKEPQGVASGCCVKHHHREMELLHQAVEVVREGREGGREGEREGNTS